MATTSPRPESWYVGVVTGVVSYVDAAALAGIGIALVIHQSSIGIAPAQIGLGSAVLLVPVAVGAIIAGREAATR